MEIKVTPCSEDQRKPIPTDADKLGFGKYFSDHMFKMEYNPQKGWHNARIEPFGPLSLSPASMVLHYGQEVFEGLKAYHGPDDSLRLFRPRDNYERLNRSCERLVIPPLDVDVMVEATRQLVQLDQAWIPRAPGCSMYVRPTVIATDPYVGVAPSETYLCFIIVGPVGAYYPEGFNPVGIWASADYVRAVRGGMGEAKTGGNYAGSLKAQMAARKEGYAQVLWLDALERKYVEEVGTMNIFFKIDGKVVTSPLTGSILPGITRDSVIKLLGPWNIEVEERMLSIDDLFAAGKDGSLEEIFGSGTAAIVTPVKEIAYKGDKLAVGDGTTGPVAQRLYDTILAIQYGSGDDVFGWSERIDG